MGAAYGGTGTALAYHEAADMILNALGGPFVIDLLSNTSLGNGFDNAIFKILLNSNVVVDQTFNDLSSAEAFFTNNIFTFQLGAGPNDLQLAFDETMSAGDAFAMTYSVEGDITPLPATLSLFVTGLGGLGLLGRRRKRKQTV